MKKNLKPFSWVSLAFIAFIMTLWACQKESIISSTFSNTSTSVKVTADMLSNDAYFQSYAMMFNEMQAKLTFLDKHKSKEEKKLIVDELSQLSQILRQKNDGSSQEERQRFAQLLGFSSISEMNTFNKELSDKRERVFERFSMLKEKNSYSNRELLKQAYAFSERYLTWRIIYTKENGSFALNKIQWKNSLAQLSTIELRCCPTGWDNDCNSNPCQKNALEELQSDYEGCNATYLEQTNSGDNFAGSDYGICLNAANTNYDTEVQQCN